MTPTDAVLLFKALSWDDTSRILICTVCTVWLLQQVHSDVRNALRGVFIRIATSIVYALMAAASAYYLMTQVDWTHIGSSTLQAGIRAFIDSTFAKKGEL
jgi:tetrahydromethanopterin S-methyltransferase subunit E